MTLAIEFPGSTNPIDYRITALSASSCTVNVKQSIAVLVPLVSLTLLQIPANVSGVTVHCHATEVGAT